MILIIHTIKVRLELLLVQFWIVPILILESTPVCLSKFNAVPYLHTYTKTNE